MSYIYEALKRAEDDNARAVAEARGLRRPAFLAARSRWWLAIGIGVLAVNAALLGALVLRGGSPAPDATVASGDRVTAPADTPPAGVASQTQAPPATAVPAPTAAARPTPTPPAAKAVTRPAPAPAPSAPAVVPPPTAAPVAARETPIAPPPPTPAAAAPSPPVVATPPPAVPAPVVAPPAPAAVAPKPAEAPRLHVQVVLYSDVPAERLVFIDGRRLAEGDRLDAETSVERITPDGAIVVRRGERITLTSGRP
jgi:hypothetical protein